MKTREEYKEYYLYKLNKMFGDNTQADYNSAEDFCYKEEWDLGNNVAAVDGLGDAWMEYKNNFNNISSSLEPEWTVFEPHFKNLKRRHESDPENGWGAMEKQQKEIIEDNDHKVTVKYGYGGSCTLYGAETGEVIFPFSTIKAMQDFKKKNNLIIVKNSRRNNMIESGCERNAESIKEIFSSKESRDKEFLQADILAQNFEENGLVEGEDFIITRTSSKFPGYDFADRYGEIYISFPKESSGFFARPSVYGGGKFNMRAYWQDYVFDYDVNKDTIHTLEKHFKPQIQAFHNIMRNFEEYGLVEGKDFTIKKISGQYMLSLPISKFYKVGDIVVTIYNTELNFNYEAYNTESFTVRPMWDFDNKHMYYNTRKDNPSILKQLEDPSAADNFTDKDPFSEGYDAYMRNDKNCPYKQGTDEFDDWVDGWQEAEMDYED